MCTDFRAGVGVSCNSLGGQYRTTPSPIGPLPKKPF